MTCNKLDKFENQIIRHLLSASGLLTAVRIMILIKPDNLTTAPFNSKILIFNFETDDETIYRGRFRDCCQNPTVCPYYYNNPSKRYWFSFLRVFYIFVREKHNQIVPRTNATNSQFSHFFHKYVAQIRNFSYYTYVTVRTYLRTWTYAGDLSLIMRIDDNIVQM